MTNFLRVIKLLMVYILKLIGIERYVQKKKKNWHRKIEMPPGLKGDSKLIRRDCKSKLILVSWRQTKWKIRTTATCSKRAFGIRSICTM